MKSANMKPCNHDSLKTMRDEFVSNLVGVWGRVAPKAGPQDPRRGSGDRLRFPEPPEGVREAEAFRICHKSFFQFLLLLLLDIVLPSSGNILFFFNWKCRY